jgi:hypothetical protein
VHTQATAGPKRLGRAKASFASVIMTVFLRFLAGVFLLIAVIAAVYDATHSLAGDRIVVLTAQEHWSRLAPATLNSARNSVRRNTHPLVWDVGLAKVLQLPAWGLLGLVGLVLAYAGRRRRRVNLYAN